MDWMDGERYAQISFARDLISFTSVRNCNYARGHDLVKFSSTYACTCSYPYLGYDRQRCLFLYIYNSKTDVVVVVVTIAALVVLLPDTTLTLIA